MISRLKSRFKNNDRIFLKCILNKYTKLFSLYIYIFLYNTSLLATHNTYKYNGEFDKFHEYFHFFI